MAPRAPMGRAQVLAWLRSSGAGSALLALGSPTVLAGIVCEQGIWRIRRAVFDGEGFRAFADAEQAAGRPVYPEYADRYRLPQGEVLLEARTLEEFIRAIEAYPWPRDW